MNPIIESLLAIVERDPLPAAHTSSHWQRYGRDTLVERRGDELFLQGVGFGSMYARNPAVRILHAIERLSYRHVTKALRCYPAVWKIGMELARCLGFQLTLDVWKCTVALAVLADHWEAHRLSPKTFALIGDGYGFLGALIYRWQSGPKLYCIDLPKQLVFQARTHEVANQAVTMSVLSADWTDRQTDRQTDITFVLPKDVELIPDEIDCAINIASMQEMKASSIESYFAFLRRRSRPCSRLYCVNRLRKELPGGEVTSFYDYPWGENDEIFIDGPCPYYTHFLAPYTLRNGPRVLGLRVPFVNYFDGAIMHRLVHLAPFPT